MPDWLFCIRRWDSDSKALEYRMKNLKIRESIAEIDKGNIEYQNSLAVAHSNLATHFKEVGHREKALEYRMKESWKSESASLT